MGLWLKACTGSVLLNWSNILCERHHGALAEGMHWLSATGLTDCLRDIMGLWLKACTGSVLLD